MTFSDIIKKNPSYQSVISKNDKVISYMSIVNIFRNYLKVFEDIASSLTDFQSSYSDIQNKTLLEQFINDSNAKRRELKMKTLDDGTVILENNPSNPMAEELFKYHEVQFMKGKDVIDDFKKIGLGIQSSMANPDSLNLWNALQEIKQLAPETAEVIDSFIKNISESEKPLDVVWKINKLTQTINLPNATTNRIINSMLPGKAGEDGLKSQFKEDRADKQKISLGLSKEERDTMVSAEIPVESKTSRGILDYLRYLVDPMLIAKSFAQYPITILNSLFNYLQIQPFINETLISNYGASSKDLDELLVQVGILDKAPSNFASHMDYKVGASPLGTRYTWIEKFNNYINSKFPGTDAEFGKFWTAFKGGGPNRLEYFFNRDISYGVSVHVLNAMDIAVENIDIIKNDPLKRAEFIERFNQIKSNLTQSGPRHRTPEYIKQIGTWIPFTTRYMNVIHSSTSKIFDTVNEFRNTKFETRGEAFKRVMDKLSKDPELFTMMWGAAYAMKMTNRLGRGDDGVGEDEQDGEFWDIYGNVNMGLAAFKGHPILGPIFQTRKDTNDLPDDYNIGYGFAKNLISKNMGSFANYTIIPNTIAEGAKALFGGSEEREKFSFYDDFTQRVSGINRLIADEIVQKYYNVQSPDGYLFNWNLATGKGKPQEEFIQSLQNYQRLMSEPGAAIGFAFTRHIPILNQILNTFSDADPRTLDAITNSKNTYAILRADDTADINQDVLRKAYSILTDFSQGYIKDEQLLPNGQKKLYNWQNYFYENIATDAMYQVYKGDWNNFVKARNNKMEQHLQMLSTFIDKGEKLPIDITTGLALGVMLQNDIAMRKKGVKGESADQTRDRGAELVRLYLPYIKMGDPKLLTQMATTDFLIKNPEYISKETKLDEQTGLVDTTKFLSLKEGADQIFSIFASNVIAGLEGKDGVDGYKSPLGNLMKVAYNPKDTPEDKTRKLEAAMQVFNHFWEYNDFIMPNPESRLSALNALAKQNYDFIKYANDNADRMTPAGKSALANLNNSTFQVNEEIKGLAAKALGEASTNGESGTKYRNNYNKNKPQYDNYKKRYNNSTKSPFTNNRSSYAPRQYQGYSPKEESYYNGRVRLSSIDNGRIVFDNKKPLGRSFAEKTKRAKLIKLNKTRRRSNTQSSRII